jgi:hypothetical protein
MRAHAIYSTRRIWRIFSLAAPSLKLPAHTDMYGDDYPFSVPVDKALDYNDLIRFNRDHYEGSEFDLTKGIQGGPYGDPARFDVAAVDGMSMKEALSGSYERSISMFRTSYSFVAVARKLKTNLLSMLWFSQYQPSTASYAPVYVAGELPMAFTRGSFFNYDPEIPFWNYLAVNNYASRFYIHAIGDVFALRDKLHKQAVEAVSAFEKHVNDLVDTMQAKERRLGEKEEPIEEHSKDGGGLTEVLREAGGALDGLLNDVMRSAVLSSMNKMCNDLVGNINEAWRDLLPAIITKYHDGVVKSVVDSNIHMSPKFYPKWWLKASGYFLEPPEKGKDVIMFEPSPEADKAGESIQSEDASGAVGTFTIMTSLTCAVLFGYVWGKNTANKKEDEIATPSDNTESWRSLVELPTLNPISNRGGYAPIA